MRVSTVPTKLPRVLVSFTEELLKKLDNYRRKQERIPSRSEAIRTLVEKALKAESKDEAN